jgi:hypothetical protein
LDAIGTTVEQFKHLQTNHADEVSGVIIGIMTDGEENVSEKFNKAQVKELTQEAEEKLKWELHYLAANQDAFQEAQALGISKAYNFADNAEGVRGSMRLMSASSALYRAQNSVVDTDFFEANKGMWEQTIAQAKTEGIK